MQIHRTSINPFSNIIHHICFYLISTHLICNGILINDKNAPVIIYP